MDDLVQWIGTQLDTDAARALQWHDLECEIHAHLDAGLLAALAASRMLEDVPGAVCDCGGPARVLREIEAKRQVLALHVITAEKADVPPFDSYTGERNPDEYNVTCAVCGWASDDRSSACLTLRLLALPYAGRDGYLPRWTPTA